MGLKCYACILPSDTCMNKLTPPPCTSILYTLHLQDFAIKTIKSTHEHWRALVQKQTNGGEIECKNISVCESPFKCSVDETRDVVQSTPALGSALPVPPEVDKWHFL